MNVNRRVLQRGNSRNFRVVLSNFNRPAEQEPLIENRAEVERRRELPAPQRRRIRLRRNHQIQRYYHNPRVDNIFELDTVVALPIQCEQISSTSEPVSNIRFSVIFTIIIFILN